MERHTILTVDDDPINLDILDEALSDSYRVEARESGEDCLEFCEVAIPDIILLDLMMPGMDGFETCRRLREMKTLKRTKIIILSAKADVADRIRGYEVGADDYLVKPFNSAELLAKVRVFLRLKSAEEVVEARVASMSEIATGVLHDVANVLNGIKVSVGLAKAQLRAVPIEDFGAVAQLLDEHRGDLTTFLDQDNRGQKLPTFLQELGAEIALRRESTLNELNDLALSIEHIREIISAQQSNERTAGEVEETSMEVVVERALQLSGDVLDGIRVERNYIDDTSISTNRHKVLQVVVNLVRNACEAMKSREDDAVLTLSVESDDHESILLRVKDNGVGLNADQLSRMFQYGYTTKKGGHGFGLHSAKAAATELGGLLLAESDGPGKGATVTLDLPRIVPGAAERAA